MPQRMADPEYEAQQWERRFDPNIKEINELCDTLKAQKPGRDLPYIDPMYDAGDCRIVSLFSSPPAGIKFVSSENEDNAAVRIAGVYEEVGLRPEHVMPWNSYPWFLFDGKEKNLTTEQLDEGLKPLLSFLRLVSRASALVAHGVDAHKLARRLTKVSNPNIQRRGFKIYEVKSTGDRAFTGSPTQQQALLDDMHTAYRDAMARAGIVRP